MMSIGRDREAEQQLVLPNAAVGRNQMLRKEVQVGNFLQKCEEVIDIDSILLVKAMFRDENQIQYKSSG